MQKTQVGSLGHDWQQMCWFRINFKI